MMTSETETLKTNEFLRRRKLRLQQVREQSKDIAKKIRQRAKVESLRQVVDLDAKKQKEYFERQEKLVKHLEVLYARGINNVGASHQSASKESQQDEIAKTDLSKLRGKEAAADLRKRRQEKLDQQKKLLDRKLQAREAANEISRDKSTVVASKLLTKSTKVVDDIPNASIVGKGSEQLTGKIETVHEPVTKNDMATQWDIDTMPNEWIPSVPPLKLPKDDQGSLKGDEHGHTSGKSKRLDLFALSKEMPSDLRGTQVHVSERSDNVRPSLTLITEYLQNRNLRLRSTEAVPTNKKHLDDMSSLKQTILRTRTTKAEGSPYNVCRVLDEQVIPVPSWHAERNCEYCSHRIPIDSSAHSKPFNSNAQINRGFSSIRPVQQSVIMPSPTLRSTSPYRRAKVFQRLPADSNCKPDNMKNRKSAVVMYNHCTRDSRDVPTMDEQFVVRDLQQSEDAYAQAMKEVSATAKDKEQQKKVQDLRNKVAVTKQTVEKEYKDTMNFLNKLPKDKGNKVTKVAYMDERRQQMHKEQRQHKMEQEYRRIENNCRRRHSCLNKHDKSRSPVKQTENDDFESGDFQYSWMPVPESDGNLAIHAIPNSVKEGKPGNSVKFSAEDSYHEYRSRHKHTPPTKDTGTHNQHSSRKRVKTVYIDKNSSASSDESQTLSNTSSVENLNLDEVKGQKESKFEHNSSDTERIIIYKILDTKNNHSKKNKKILNDIAKSLTNIEKVQQSVTAGKAGAPKTQTDEKVKPISQTGSNTVSFEQINEGIYKVNEKGDNFNSMQHSDNLETKSISTVTGERKNQKCPCKILDPKKGLVLQWQFAENMESPSVPKSCQCSSTSQKKYATPSKAKNDVGVPVETASPSISAVSFKTADNKKQANPQAEEGGYVKLLDEAGHEAGKFFLGPAGFLEDNAYEVVIRLRKKHDTKDEKVPSKAELSEQVSNLAFKKDAAIQSDSNAEVVAVNKQVSTDIEMHDVSTFGNIKEIVIPPVPTHSESSQKCEENETEKQNTIAQDAPSMLSMSNEIHLVQSVEDKKDMSDKGIDPPSRPATTTYTQTTNSPFHRPMYIHMSSSTSTAYMSPPEKILPKYLNQGYVMTDDNPYEFQNIVGENTNYNKRRRKCKHNRKSHSDVNVKRVDYNTSLSPNSADYLQKHVHTESQRPKTCTPRQLKQDKTKCNCRKCGGRDINNKKLYKQCYVNKKAGAVNYRTPHFQKMSLTKNAAQNMKYKSTSSSVNKRSTGSSLNSVVRDYVNRLLALNREGLKAIEVADQECSSVGTPGSSIINVANNVDESKPSGNKKMSLEHIKKLLSEHIVNENLNKNCISTLYANASQYKNEPRKPRRKPVHKIKSLNISKNLLKNYQPEGAKQKKRESISTTDDNSKTFASTNTSRSRSQSVPSSSQTTSTKQYKQTDMTKNKEIKKTVSHGNNHDNSDQTVSSSLVREKPQTKQSKPYLRNKTVLTDKLPKSESSKYLNDYSAKNVIPSSMSTQTSHNLETDFVKVAEDKLLNMEKIANLTEKCTKRLSNLAKFLEEVRKNKSSVYSQISASDSAHSQSGHKSDNVERSPTQIDSTDNVVKSPMRSEAMNLNKLEMKSSEPILQIQNDSSPVKEKPHSEYFQFLADIPKLSVFQPTEQSVTAPVQSKMVNEAISQVSTSPADSDTDTFDIIKCRPKPPPALSRIHLKHSNEYIVPHELSTVIEVDSPMSVKNKNQSHRNDLHPNSNRSSNDDKELVKSDVTPKESTTSVNPDLLQSNPENRKQTKGASTESSDDSKFQMIDLKQFNEIMLEPFISIHEYAKKYNVEALDEGSNMDDIQRGNLVNDDNTSSLHSDGSLPDVIAELLKRNIITEPFKFDTPSNINSNTFSSESTLSMLALSKARKVRKRSSVIFQNKENIGETSDTLSISSNPDLENAFKKLGMGWASSTLKKTKERLALSSSSNTSSSSLPQFKINTFNQDVPALVTDSVSSVLLSRKEQQTKNFDDHSKNSERSNFANSMIVKEFLTKELANKITFNNNNRSTMNDTEEFISLFETKMPEGLQQQSHRSRNDQTNDSLQSGAVRARTSTPVQLFKSMSYHSSSSSNISNGLFSNADDLSSVKITPNSMKNYSTSNKDDLTIPNFSLRMKKGSDTSKSD